MSTAANGKPQRHLLLCVHVFLLVYSHGCAGTCMCLCMLKVSVRYLPQTLSTLVFEVGLVFHSIWSLAIQLDWLAQRAPGSPLSLLPPGWDYRHTLLCPLFLLLLFFSKFESWSRMDLGLHACTANIFLTKPSPSPKTTAFKRAL